MCEPAGRFATPAATACSSWRRTKPTSASTSAVACALDPTPFTLWRGAVRVVTDGIAAGQTIQMLEGANFMSNAWDGVPTQSVCIGVDAPRLRAEFRACFVR